MSEAIARPAAAAQIAGLIFAVLLVDDNYRVAEANPAAEDMLGASARRLVGAPLRELIEIADARVMEHLESASGQLVVRGVAVRAGGAARRVNLTVSPLASDPGWRVVTLLDVGQADMDEESDLPPALRTPAVLAHEIKNPLAAIRGAAQLLARKLEEKDRALTTLIAEEVDRIARLVDRMQKLGSRRSEPLEPVNLHRAIRRAAASLVLAGMDGVDLIEEFDPSLPPVLASGDALEQVVANLLANARDACQAVDAPRIVIRTRFAGGMVLNAIRLGRPVKLPIEITISDNGPGVAAELRDHVFEPFVTNKAGGQGLGLALVRKLVNDMDGRIVHIRDDREGTTQFRINLPVAK